MNVLFYLYWNAVSYLRLIGPVVFFLVIQFVLVWFHFFISWCRRLPAVKLGPVGLCVLRSAVVASAVPVENVSSPSCPSSYLFRNKLLGNCLSI